MRCACGSKPPRHGSLAAFTGTAAEQPERKPSPPKPSKANRCSKVHHSMATTASSFLSPAKFAFQSRLPNARTARSVRFLPARAQQQVKEEETAEPNVPPPQEEKKAAKGPAQSLPLQPLAESKNLSREYGGQWLSSTTRHIRIYAAYIDPETNAFDQTQMDKLTLMLDPTDEFVWTDETCQKVYNEFQDLVDHYEGAPLSEYTLRLIGSDLEHYIRKLLYDGEIKYNMRSRVLNFSMGKPRVKFNSSQIPDVK